MRLRWTASAARDLENITNYLFGEAPQNAPRLVRSIYEAIGGLEKFPRRGRIGKKRGTRELVLAPLPYVVVYETSEEFVRIVRILHAAQQWPAS
jgi:addiction module RelE/StbE family toxin